MSIPSSPPAVSKLVRRGSPDFRAVRSHFLEGHRMSSASLRKACWRRLGPVARAVGFV